MLNQCLDLSKSTYNHIESLSYFINKVHTESMNIHDDHQMAFLYGVLYKSNRTEYFDLICATVRDGYNLILGRLYSIVTMYRQFSFLSLNAFQSLLWLISKFLRLELINPILYDVCLSLLSQLVIGRSNKNKELSIWMMIYLGWIIEHKMILPQHTRINAINILAMSMSLGFKDSLSLIVLRELIDLSNLTLECPDIIRWIYQLEVTYQGKIALPCEYKFCTTSISVKHILHFSLEMEQMFIFMLENVPNGREERYQQWFKDRYFDSRFSLVVEFIRYICIWNQVYESDNAKMKKCITMIDWLLSLSLADDIHFANAKLALFYDWLWINEETQLGRIAIGWNMLLKSLFKQTLIEFLFLFAQEDTSNWCLGRYHDAVKMLKQRDSSVDPMILYIDLSVSSKNLAQMIRCIFKPFLE